MYPAPGETSCHTRTPLSPRPLHPGGMPPQLLAFSQRSAIPASAQGQWSCTRSTETSQPREETSGARMQVPPAGNSEWKPFLAGS